MGRFTVAFYFKRLKANVDRRWLFRQVSLFGDRRSLLPADPLGARGPPGGDVIAGARPFPTGSASNSDCAESWTASYERSASRGARTLIGKARVQMPRLESSIMAKTPRNGSKSTDGAWGSDHKSIVCPGRRTACSATHLVHAQTDLTVHWSLNDVGRDGHASRRGIACHAGRASK